MIGLRLGLLLLVAAVAVSGLCCRTEAKTGPRCEIPSITYDTDSRKMSEEPILFNWALADSKCTNVRFLAASFPNTVRFSGKGFFALAPGEPGPHQLKWATDRMRIFIPLHYGPEVYSGSLTVRFLTTGSADVEWTYVEFEKGTVLSNTQLSSIRFQVYPGAPQLSVIDRFSDDRPDKSYLDVNRRYRLEVWPGRYRVTDIKTGGLIVEREGERPAFSPTGRFIAAFRRGAHFLEVVDILSRKVEGSIGSPDVQAGYGRIDVVSWGASDSFLVTGNAGYGSADVLQTFVDRQSISTVTGGPTHPWLDTSLEIDIDLGVVWRAYIGENGAEPARPQQTLFGAFGTDNDSGEADFIDRRLLPTLSGWEDRPVPRKPSWRLPGIPIITHDVPVVGDSPEMAQYADDIRASQIPYLLKPIEESIPESSDVRVVSKSTRRGFSALSDDEIAHEQRSMAQLANFGIHVELSDPGNNVFASYPGEDINTAIKRLVDFLGGYLTSHPDVVRFFHNPQTSPCMNAQLFDERVDTLAIRYAWTWKAGDVTVALFQTHCEVGNGGLSGEGALQLIVVDGSSKARLQQIESSLGIDQYKAVAPFLLDDRHLAIVGTNRTLLVYDFAAGRSASYLTGIQGGDIVKTLSRTVDKTHYLQMNADGQLFLYQVADGKRILNGYFVDDEVVLYTQEGYYDASLEGASFVNLRFAGIGADFELGQFQRQLRRPDVIRAIVDNKRFTLGPETLAIPPSIHLTAADHLIDNRLDVTIEGQAVEGFSGIEVYLDGMLADRVEFKGQVVSIKYTLAPLPGTRRADFVATDRRGIRSTAASMEFGAGVIKGLSKRKLTLIVVGTDAYDDTALSHLKYAVADARRFAGAAEGTHSGYYDGISVVQLLNEPMLNFKLEVVLKELKRSATAGDTLMMFFAGHGLQDKSGALYIAAKSTKVDDLSKTAVSWRQLSSLIEEIDARTIVFLDVCHAGSAGNVGTNDDATAGLVSTRKAMTIFAASKGRQFSLEDAQLQGGEFTVALTTALAKEGEYDINHNGAVEVSELYRATKSTVVKRTGGRQTPWIARNGFVGDVPVF